MTFLPLLDSGLEELPLKYLPPLSLHFSLPEDYPSHLSPTYTLSCQWLENSKVWKALNIEFCRIMSMETLIYIF
jgi:hypothetical protein